MCNGLLRERRIPSKDVLLIVILQIAVLRHDREILRCAQDSVQGFFEVLTRQILHDPIPYRGERLHQCLLLLLE